MNVSVGGGGGQVYTSLIRLFARKEMHVVVGEGAEGGWGVIKCEVIKKGYYMIIKEMGGWRVAGWG